MGEEYAHEKGLVRRRLQAARGALSASDVARCSAAACTLVVELGSFAESSHVVVYAAIRNEIDPAAIGDRAIRCGKSVYYPSMERGEFAFRRSADGPPGSDGTRSPLLDPAADEVVFVVPGVAFDPRGARLGRGDGWYDRAFARYRGGVRLGLAYDFQVLPHVAEAPWDVRMHAVVTDARLVQASAVLGRQGEIPR
jgi:5-formyltetrahydrofolate cyclo-ligase